MESGKEPDQIVEIELVINGLVDLVPNASSQKWLATKMSDELTLYDSPRCVLIEKKLSDSTLNHLCRRNLHTKNCVGWTNDVIVSVSGL